MEVDWSFNFYWNLGMLTFFQKTDLMLFCIESEASSARLHDVWLMLMNCTGCLIKQSLQGVHNPDKSFLPAVTHT